MSKLVMGEQIPHENLITSINEFISKSKHYIKPTIFKFKLQIPRKAESFNQPQLLMNSNAFESTLNSNTSNYEYHMDEEITHFIITCIEYCVLKQVKDVCIADHQRIEVLAGMMREFYLKMSTEGEWKKEFIFEQNLILVTKMVGEFYNRMFLNLSANGKLESEIYIILMHTLLGVKINTACFQVLEKKHIRKIKPIKHNKENKDLLNKKDSTDKNCEKRATVMKKPMKNDRDSMLIYYSSKRCSLNKMNKTLMENHRESEISPAEEFKNSLKESLYIHPLPMLKKPKASIESFATQNYHQLNSFDLQDNKSKEYEKEARNSSFLSTEISSSLKSEIEKRNVSISVQNHPFKIKHRFPYASLHLYSIKNSSVSENKGKIENENFFFKEKNDSSKFNSQQWNKTFIGLKTAYLQEEANYTQPKKSDKEDKMLCNRLELNDSKSEIGNKSLMNSTVSFDLSLKDKQEIKTIKERETCGFEAFKEEKFAKRQSSFVEEKQPLEFRLDCGTKDYKNIELSDFCIERPKKNNISSKFLKTEQSVFDLLAKQRKEKIKYSMFMLPSVRDKLGV